MFDARGLKVGAWNLPFCPYREESEWNDGVERLPARARLASELGALRTAMWILPSHDSLSYRENFVLHVARFQPIARILDEHGVRIGLEFIGPKTSRRLRYEFIHTLDGMRELCRAIGDNVGLLLDSWHFYSSGGSIEELQSLTNQELVHIHINDAPAGIPRDEQIDNQRRLPGTTGVIDITGFLKALTRAGYDGPVTAEPFDKQLNALSPEEAAAENARTVLDVLKRAGV
jgi:sugar phosphate isomerase/epimerase